MKYSIEYLSGIRWLVAVVIAIVISVVLTAMICHALLWPALCAGWALALANAGLAATINYRAIGLGIQRFLGWVLIANALRVLVVLGIIMTAYHRTSRDAFSPFLIALGVGYFVFLHGEILALYAGLRDRHKEEGTPR